MAKQHKSVSVEGRMLANETVATLADDLAQSIALEIGRLSVQSIERDSFKPNVRVTVTVQEIE